MTTSPDRVRINANELKLGDIVLGPVSDFRLTALSTTNPDLITGLGVNETGTRYAINRRPDEPVYIKSRTKRRVVRKPAATPPRKTSTRKPISKRR